MQKLGTDESEKKMRREIPLGRMGDTNDIAGMCCFLFSEEGLLMILLFLLS